MRGGEIYLRTKKFTLSRFHFLSVDLPAFSEFPNAPFLFSLEGLVFSLSAARSAICINTGAAAGAAASQQPTNHELPLQVSAAVSDSRCEFRLRCNKSLQLGRLQGVWGHRGKVTPPSHCIHLNLMPCLAPPPVQ